MGANTENTAYEDYALIESLYVILQQIDALLIANDVNAAIRKTYEGMKAIKDHREGYDAEINS